MSADALKNGHAEHIHDNCTCQYAVRFDEKSSIEGYDSDRYRQIYGAAAGSTPEEKIRFIRRTIATEQEYRKVKRGKAETFTFERNKQKFSISVKKIETYERAVYISDNAKIKPKVLNAIVKNTKEAEREYGLSEAEISEIVILAKEELDGAYGLYDACTNRTYYNELITDKEIQRMAGGENITERHETWHVKQAANYKEKHGDITEENKEAYLSETCKKAKVYLDTKGITEENVGEISEYAKMMYERKRYDEVEADYKALRKEKKR